jgi:uncharacterized membrane protein YjfL (UPF0719 family)
MNTDLILSPCYAIALDWNVVAASVVYAVIGIILFAVSFVLVDLLTPYNLWKELVEKKNTAIAFVVGMVALGICIIVAAAIH